MKKDLERVRLKGYPRDLEALLIRLREIASEAGFSHEDARLELVRQLPMLDAQARNVVMGRKKELGKRVISGWLGPNPARPSPPPEELVEVFLQLFRAAQGDEAGRRVREEILQLYRGADSACESAAGARQRTPPQELPELVEARGLIDELNAEISSREEELEQLRTALVESDWNRHESEVRIRILTSEVTDLRQQLVEVTAERDEARSQHQLAEEERDRAREQLIRATAESDQQQAHIDHLESEAAHSPR